MNAGRRHCTMHVLLHTLSVAAAAACPTCRATLVQTKHGDRACEAGTDFGCYPGEDAMWVRRASACGGYFDCNSGHAAVRCGSRYMKLVPGEDRANCSCVPPAQPQPRRRREPATSGCGASLGVDSSGGVSAAYRRLPQPPGADTSVKCCRNKHSFGGPINRSVTLEFTKPRTAPWPEDCEPLCTNHPSGRCRFFTHSYVWKSCILCTECQPEIMIGDGSQSSYALASDDPSKLYTGCNSVASCAEAAAARGEAAPVRSNKRRLGRGKTAGRPRRRLGRRRKLQAKDAGEAQS